MSGSAFDTFRHFSTQKRVSKRKEELRFGKRRERSIRENEKAKPICLLQLRVRAHIGLRGSPRFDYVRLQWDIVKTLPPHDESASTPPSRRQLLSLGACALAGASRSHAAE